MKAFSPKRFGTSAGGGAAVEPSQLTHRASKISSAVVGDVSEVTLCSLNVSEAELNNGAQVKARLQVNLTTPGTVTNMRASIYANNVLVAQVSASASTTPIAWLSALIRSTGATGKMIGGGFLDNGSGAGDQTGTTAESTVDMTGGIEFQVRAKSNTASNSMTVLWAELEYGGCGETTG